MDFFVIQFSFLWHGGINKAPLKEKYYEKFNVLI